MGTALMRFSAATAISIGQRIGCRLLTVDAYPGDTFIGVISQLRLNPITTQNVVIYSAVIQVDNPE